MSESLVHALLAIRGACVDIKSSVPSSTRGLLDTICLILAKQIADARDLPEVKRKMIAQFSPRLALLPGIDLSNEPAAFDQALVALQQVLRRTGAATGTASSLLKLAADIGASYACTYDQAIAREISAASTLAAADKSQDEAFDADVLRDYLVATFPDETALKIDQASIVSRGFSKKTMIVGLKDNRVLPNEIVLRIDRPYNFLGTTVVDEYAPLIALHEHGLRVPKPYAVETSGKVVGAPFIVFERVPGVPVGSNLIFPPRNPDLAGDVAASLALLHRAPLDAFASLRGIRESIQDGVRWEIEKSYADWRALDRSVPVVEAAFCWLRSNIHRTAGRRAILHGDFNFNNLLVEGNRVSAIVDWEFVHAGNPASDLGWFHYGAESVAGWEPFLTLYEDAGGIRPSSAELDYFILLGQTQLGVIALQMDSGSSTGKFDDIRYAQVGPVIVNKLLMRISSKLEELLIEN